jgi:hypothetical protein
MVETISPDEQRRRLAQVYALILSWPMPSDIETTDPWNIDKVAEQRSDETSVLKRIRPSSREVLDMGVRDER